METNGYKDIENSNKIKFSVIKDDLTSLGFFNFKNCKV